MKLPETENDLLELVRNNIPESLHLDYKASEALSDKKKDEILKDVSAFANSDGGILIYGIKEDKSTKTLSMDNGINASDRNYREWLENIVDSGISPKISQLRINAIQLTNGNFAYALEVPKSTAAPHQSPDKKYYKRFNSKSEPMEHYEIEDIRNRSSSIEPLVNIDIELFDGIGIGIVISNQGKYTAKNIRFLISKPMNDHWMSLRPNFPLMLKNGLSQLPPRKVYKLPYDSYQTIIRNDNLKNAVIEVCYFHPQINSDKTDRFEFNFEETKDVLVDESDIKRLSIGLSKNLEQIQSTLKEVNRNIENISRNMGQMARVESTISSYFIEKGNSEILYEYDCRVMDVVSSSHGLFLQSLSRFIYFIENDKNISEQLTVFLPIVDFEIWYKQIMGGVQGIGKGELKFPENDLERLSLLKGLLKEMSVKRISYTNISMYFMPSGINLDNSVTEIIRMLFIPFARDIRFLLAKNLMNSY